MTILTELGTVVGSLAITYGLKILGAIAIYIVGRWVAGFIVKGLRNMMARSGVDEMLINFGANVAYFILLAVIIIAALNVVGVPTTSAVAIVGAAGLAIGFALQDSLSNFAAGVMIIFFKPFKVGDLVDIAGENGVVEKVQVFTTTLVSLDNREIIIPNAAVLGGNIVNQSAKPARRLDMVFGIGYDDDIRAAKALLTEILAQNELVLESPASQVAVGELADSSVNFVVRPYVRPEHYWDVWFAVTEEVKLRFDEAGISIPYPQQDIHLHQATD